MEPVINILKKILVVLGIPAALLIRLLRPFVTIRFGELYYARLGHFTSNTEVYLCEKDAGLHGHRTLDIFYYPYRARFCNYQLKKMWDRSIPVSRFASLIDKSSRLLPAREKHIIPWREAGDRDIYGLLSRTKTHLSFTEEEERFGREELLKLGIRDDDFFVCIAARDKAYLDTVFSHHSREHWNYHDYRDCSIQNYLSAANYLTEKSYYVIRMGAAVKDFLKTKNPKIIDYAANGKRTDFLDIYLGAKCKFFLSASFGITGVPLIFRRPIAYVNQIPLEGVWTWNKNYISIFKKLWLRKEKRFMTFKEIIESGAGRFLFFQQYERLGVDIVDNISEEIEALVVEMDERLNGTWITTDEDECLQERFWSIFPKNNDWHGEILGRIGAHFLRENKELLGYRQNI